MDCLGRAKDGDGLTADMVFQFSDCFSYGPAGSKDILSKVSYRFIDGSGVCFSEIHHDPTDFIRYLKEVKELLQKYSMPIVINHPLFWMKPILHDGEKARVWFSWVDTYRESVDWRDAILEEPSEAPEDVYFDADQGWMVEIYKDSQSFFYRICADPDEDTIYKIDKIYHRKQVKDAWVRMVEVIEMARLKTGLDLTAGCSL